MRKFLSLVLALAMAMSLVVVNTSAKEFTDSDELNYQEAVDVISEIGVVDGYADGSFNPQGGLTRGAAAKIICNLILGPTTAAELHADTRPYPDVAVDSEFAGYIAYCAQQGIISGYADGEFKAANPLTGYAFMKMLLGALGYSSDIEQYVGENWSINVAKQAIGIGLNQGLVDEFNGVDYVTREEAALYAFNTLKATLVDYENTITADVNGASVTISNNTAKPVTWSEGINEDGNIWDDNFVQFAEEYFPDLERKDDDTKFMEPANTWLYDRVEIGTYERTDLLVETYTTGVSGRDIYDLLKAGVIKNNDFDAYLDGVDNEGTNAGEVDKDDFVRSHTDDLGSTGNGVLTKVYLDSDKELITLVSINTYLAKAMNNYSEANEYATLRVFTGVTGGEDKTLQTATYNVDVEEVPEVADVTEDTFYRVNISYKDVSPEGEIVVIDDVEILEDSTISEYSSDNGNKEPEAKVTKLTTGGEEYEANEKAFYDDDILYSYNENLLTDNTYNVYLDQYGYFLGVDLFEGTKNYVFITGFDRNTSNLAVKTATAGAIFLDGTMKNIQVNVTATDDNIEEVRDENPMDDNANLFVPWSTLTYPTMEVAADGTPTITGGNDLWNDRQKGGVDGIFNLNQWYTYTVTEDGVYTLKPCVRMTWTAYPDPDDPQDDVIIRTDNLSIQDDHPAAVDNSIANLPGRVYGEDATVFLTVDLDIVDTSSGARAITDVNGVYTGVQSVDLVVETDDNHAVEQGQVYTVYDSDGYVIAAVVIGEALGNTGDYAYILSEAKNERYADGVYSWDFDAVYEGVERTLTAISSYDDTIDQIDPGDVVELRFDGENVTDIKQVTDLYDDWDVEDISNFDVYYMSNHELVDPTHALSLAADDPDVVSLQGNTLYITSNRQDPGLGVLRGEAKAVIIQDENGKSDVVRCFDDVESAVSYLPDGDNIPENGKQYYGVIMAVLDSRSAATWIVFDSDTALTTGTDQGYGTQGNVLTRKRNDVPLVVNGDQKAVLSGSHANVTFTVNEWGVLTATMDYTAPEWVPANGASVSIGTQVLYYGGSVGAIGAATFSGPIVNGKATLTWSSDPFDFLPYTDLSKITFQEFGYETISAVNAYWFDGNGNALSTSVTGEPSTLTTVGTVGESFALKMANTSTGNATLTLTNVSKTSDDSVYASTGVNVAYSDLRSTAGWVVSGTTNANSNIYATSDGAPVVAVLNTGTMVNTYALTTTLTGDKAAALGLTSATGTAQAINLLNTALTTVNDTIVVKSDLSAAAGNGNGLLVTFTATAAAGDGSWENNLYKVTLTTTAGKDLVFEVGPGATTDDDSVRFTGSDISITGMTVEVVDPKLAKPTITQKADEPWVLVVKFNQGVGKTGGSAFEALTATAIEAQASDSTSITSDVRHTADSDTVEIELNRPLADDDKVVITGVEAGSHTSDTLTSVTLTYDAATQTWA